MYVYGELVNAQLENLASDPATTSTSRIYWNTTTVTVRLYNAGGGWRSLLANDQHCKFGTSATNSIRWNRAGVNLLQLLHDDDTTAEGSLSSTGMAMLSARVENYVNASVPAANALFAGRILWVTDTGLVKIDNGGAYLTFCDTTTAQTLTNKTLTGPKVTDFVDFAQIATPANPAANRNRLYFKAGDSPCYLNSAGVEVTLQAAKTINDLGFSVNGTWTVPAGVTKAWVLGRGGSGGGGGGQGLGGGGLGGGGVSSVMTLVDGLTPGDIVTITIGAAGAGGAAGNGVTNGTSGGDGGDTIWSPAAGGAFRYKGAKGGGGASVTGNGSYDFQNFGSPIGCGGHGGISDGVTPNGNAGSSSVFAAGGAKGTGTVAANAGGGGGGGGDGAGGAGGNGGGVPTAGAVGTSGGGGGGGGTGPDNVSTGGAGGAGTVGHLTVIWYA